MVKARQKQRDRRQEILDAAAVVITERGLADTRIQDIAERCGVSPGLILYYFESKDRLLVEALIHANDTFYLRVSREMRQLPSAKERMSRMIELSVPGLLPEYSLLDEWALWVEVWVRALRDPRIAKEREALDRRWVQSLADIIRYGRQTGEFPGDEPGNEPRNERDADDLALQLGAVMDGLAIQVLLNDTVMTPTRMQEIVTDAATRLVGYDAA